MEQKKKTNTFPMYKDKPLVRCGDIIYYGDVEDDYVVKIDIKGQEKLSDMDFANDVKVQLVSTEDLQGSKPRIIKMINRNNLYDALDVADVWLHRALET